jgi:hypothetical protein
MQCGGCEADTRTTEGCIHVKFRPTAHTGSTGFCAFAAEASRKGPQVTTLRAVFKSSSMRCSRPTPSTRFYPVRSTDTGKLGEEATPTLGGSGSAGLGALGACGAGFFSRQASGTRVLYPLQVELRSQSNPCFVYIGFSR